MLEVRNFLISSVLTKLQFHRPEFQSPQVTAKMKANPAAYSAGLLIQFLRRQSQGHRAKECAAPGTSLPNKELQTFLPGNTIVAFFLFNLGETKDCVKATVEETTTMCLICLIKML